MKSKALQQGETLDFSTLLASTVHDLKNSVGHLLGTLRDTTNELPPHNRGLKERFGHLQYDAMRVSNDLIQLLAVYKIDHGLYSMDIAHHSVPDVLEECVLQYAPLFEHKHIAMEMDCPDDLYWFFDRSLISGVMNNIFNNAIHYTKDALLLRAFETAEGLTIQLEDNGPGYPQQMLIADSSTARGIDFGKGSTGLGLYFAALAARQHTNLGKCGHVTIDNDGTLKGGRFSILLP